MTDEVKPRYTREQIAQMATETVTVPKYSHEELVRMMNEAEGAPSQIVTPDETPKVWTQGEIKELRNSGKMTDAILAEIKAAMAGGRVV